MILAGFERCHNKRSETAHTKLAKCVHNALIIRTLGSGTGSDKFENKHNIDDRQLAITGSSGYSFWTRIWLFLSLRLYPMQETRIRHANVTMKFVAMQKCTDFLKI
jgi:hypothetical protein